MTYHEFVAHLEDRGCRPRKSTGGHAALCPAHDDRSPSLSLREGRDGRVLLYCFAGCTYASIVAALDLDARDLCQSSDPGVRRYGRG